MITLLKEKKGFTFVELIFVIIILGIISSIGSSAIVQTYQSYIMQRSVHSASINTELAINQLANRLTYRMDLVFWPENLEIRVQLKVLTFSLQEVYHLLKEIAILPLNGLAMTVTALKHMKLQDGVGMLT